MKRIILNILILLLFTFTAKGSVDSLFNAGNTLYSEGNYEEAIAVYQEILDTGYESAELYYNLGNSAFRSNKLGYSVLYFKKALKTDPGFEPAATNLEFVSLYLEDKLESVPEFFLKKWIRLFYNLLPVAAWSVISISLFVLFLLCMMLYVFASRMWLKKTGFFTGALSLILFILSFSSALKQHNHIKNPDQAIIIAPSVLVKSTPSDSGTDLFVLHEGTSMETDEVVGEWVEIKIIDGRVGWVKSKTIEII